MRADHRTITLPTIALLALLFSLPLAADDNDHERARQALEAGEILPLGTIINKIERDYPGQILEVELEREDGRWIYEIKQLREGGSLVKMELDAADGTLLGIKGRDIAPAPKPEQMR
ncbi:MAG: PepSY domain-containing protein [Gammaproteobacteria bacterium]|nr:PepSY domain-containing protein [Gammaproteobacteria bacterium]MCW8841503.1 PepSY domain-containing protein [Gammaproteobacteria bacterium]MCW8958031.1 PepSY domain-containing protein [Gammaproteobacteria bacterium]MCW8974059.1 PepSY domain-containing protein [Gammaproteobacteria bacterium]MCW8993897.1 PepSY domain-containing protein [Gammaproteobacteria bacterium]